MQAEHPRPEDAASLPTPSSPTLSSFRHHAPTPRTEAPQPSRQSSSSSLPHRRFHADTTAGDADVLTICLRTPFDDGAASSSRKERIVSGRTGVAELKDRLAAEGDWQREGMRLIWHGRILRDEEKLGDALVVARASPVHTIHVVARPTEASVKNRPKATPTTVIPPAATPGPSTSVMPAPAGQSRKAVAVSETVHYLLFMARHHLCCLLDMAPMQWEEMVPAATISQSAARLGVMSVMRTLAAENTDRQEGWEEWDRAFDDEPALQGGSDAEEIIKGLWSAQVGRAYGDSPEGETVSVELDGLPYQLHLPPLANLSAKHKSHLLQYLRVTAILPLTYPILEAVSRTSTAPVPTVPLPRLPSRRVVYHREFRFSLPSIPFPVLVHIFFSFAKLLAMLWMLTRDMKWNDVRLWIIGGAAAGWWIGDAITKYRSIMRQRRRAEPQRPLTPNPDEQGNIAQGAVTPDGQAQTDSDTPVPPGAAPPPDIERRRARRTRARNPLTAMGLVHLDTDRRQLLLSRSNSAPRLTGRRERQPPWFQTQVLLPVWLWLVTLVPEWEAARARRIRRRERAMRVVVGERSALPSPIAPNAPLPAVDDASEGLGVPAAAAPEAARRHVLPEGLNDAARKYYERVLQRGEGIDWEEEREAQRALGIAEEDDPPAGGIALF